MAIDPKTFEEACELEDTLNDIAGYAIIGLMLRKGWFELPLKEE